MTTEAIKALVGLEAELRGYLEDQAPWRYATSDMEKVLAAIEALKPIAEGTHVVVKPSALVCLICLRANSKS